jgi:hypothetical protein
MREDGLLVLGEHFQKNMEMSMFGRQIHQTPQLVNTTTCKVIAIVWAKPGEPLLTYVDNYPRESFEEAMKLATK